MGLTAIQWQFIAARLLAATDKEAAEQVGIHPTRIADWKAEQPEFAQEYEAAFTDGVHVAKSYTRKLLGKAAKVLDDALEAKFGRVPDQKARLKAVELLFKTHGMLRERVEWTPNLSELSDEELLTLERVLGRITPAAS